MTKGSTNMVASPSNRLFHRTAFVSVETRYQKLALSFAWALERCAYGALSTHNVHGAKSSNVRLSQHNDINGVDQHGELGFPSDTPTSTDSAVLFIRCIDKLSCFSPAVTPTMHHSHSRVALL